MVENTSKKIKKEINKTLSILCNKSKRICAICETELTHKVEKSNTGRFTLISVLLNHPKFKSKKFKVCGNCYTDIRRASSFVPKN